MNSELGDTCKVQMNDTVLAFPCEIRKLEAAGVNLDREYTPENYEVDVGECVVLR